VFALLKEEYGDFNALNEQQIRHVNEALQNF
jgi:hypothetical protein